MSEIKTGGPAFPLQSIGPDFEHGYAGMTLRDYFAAKALQGLSANSDNTRECWKEPEEIAKQAYILANAMIEERGEQ